MATSEGSKPVNETTLAEEIEKLGIFEDSNSQILIRKPSENRNFNASSSTSSASTSSSAVNSISCHPASTRTVTSRNSISCHAYRSPISNSNSNRSKCHHTRYSIHWDAIDAVKSTCEGNLKLGHFKKIKKIGGGATGTVFLAELRGTETYFAVKVEDVDSDNITRIKKEVQFLQMLDHPLLPTLYFQCQTAQKYYIVTEYCAAGDLNKLRQKQLGCSFPEEIARFYCAEILLALEYLHSLGIVYRDLKPENVLIREDGHLMLTDFDLSQAFQVRPMLADASCKHKKSKSREFDVNMTPCKKCMKTCLLPCFLRKGVKKKHGHELDFVAEPCRGNSNSIVGTREYLAPEIIEEKGHGNAVDWWTLGVFLYELLYGTTPFIGWDALDTINNIVDGDFSFPAIPHVSREAKDLIRALLVKEPDNRFGRKRGASEIKKHAFFEGLKWPLLLSRPPVDLPQLHVLDSEAQAQNQTPEEIW